MEILQMPLPALQERIDQELESNIALEIDEGAESAETAADEQHADAPGENAEEFARLDSMERDFGEDYDNTYGSRGLRRERSGDGDWRQDFMANLRARGDSLQDEVLHQWTFAEVESDIAKAGQVLIESLSPDGLLEVPLEELADTSVSHDALEQALATLQTLVEPSGIGARSLQECLLLQVRAQIEQAPEDAAAWGAVQALIEDHLDDLVQNRLPDIVKATPYDMAQVRDAMRLMHRLSLAPGKDLTPDDVLPVIPDVLVEYDDVSDTYVATLLDGPIPPLRVSPRYVEMARDKAVDTRTRQFLERNVDNARWLVDALQQRGATLLKVVDVVLDKQRPFFDEGPRSLKPLPMTAVADIIGVHVATISRTVADKWMQTPRGILPLRRFFSGGTATSSGEQMSWDAVREVLREVVEQEDCRKPHSDEALAAALRERGIDIARRTVVKYRQKMGIPPARLRREH
ncbi:MAG: RNA polymerase factor sigma-54 [Phycisphaerales bacterium]|nr:RNA polymerase factor sigma-54 [Phycisphaerales bacterium]